MARSATCAAILLIATSASTGAQSAPPPRSPADTIERLVIRRWTVDGRVQSLDSLFGAYRDSMQRDIRYEWQLSRAFGAFDVEDKSLGPGLDRWVQTSRLPYGRIARALYGTTVAWTARGTEYADETPDSKFRSMRAHLARAAEDVSAAMRMDARSHLPHWVALRIAQADGDSSMSDLLEQGLARAPASFILRARYMDLLRPRWYGTHEEMAAFAEASQRHAAANPPIRWLRGYVAWDSARTLKEMERYEAALQQFDRAVAAGDYALFRLDRGKLLYRLDRYDQALIDLNRAAMQWPQSAEVYNWRGWVYLALARAASDGHQQRAMLMRAEKDLSLALALNPADEETRKQLSVVRTGLEP